ncbi:hypothetical protein NIIDMKKI_44080 [Mycobacterium kansasii]|uniref:Polyketide cyclase / dehydrase and lipid transport family protein n=1 Tax=Mycobacterium kansasii TaxID=1768 RepID=A0A7G1IGY1_MYCKA|nr:hypothetical protein NIIDMKKI_44080 [Mycobacterium kansasii]
MRRRSGPHVAGGEVSRFTPREVGGLAGRLSGGLMSVVMFPCERVELTFLDPDSGEAPYLFRNSVELAITPEQLFEVLADADAWPRWASAIKKVTWTSPQPYHVGTTRSVDMHGGMEVNEEFLVWEPVHRMAFRFNECSTQAVAAFAEDYRVEVIPGGCRLTWTMAQSPPAQRSWACSCSGRC